MKPVWCRQCGDTAGAPLQWDKAMKIRYNAEIIAGSSFTIVSAVLYAMIPTEIITLEKTSVNAQTVPRIALGGLFIFSLLLLLQGLFMIPKREVVLNRQFLGTRQYRDIIRSCIYLALIVIYVLLFKAFGFILSSIYLIVSILLYYGTRKKSYYAIALGISAIVYLVFTLVLNISLP